MSITGHIWFQVIKFTTPIVWKILPKETQKDILQELRAWQEVLKFRKRDYYRQLEINNLIHKLCNK